MTLIKSISGIRGTIGGAVNNGLTPLDGFYIIRGSVQSAILSGYEVVDRVLE